MLLACGATDTAWDPDGDGWLVPEDCAPADETRHPGADELADDVDQDCDGFVDEGTPAYDDDGDGFTEDEGDCDDADPEAHPGAEETPWDGVDQDCSGADLLDADGDGHEVPEDCDDHDAESHPGAEELPDGLDQDCDGDVDEGTTAIDEDGDGYSELDGDCDDSDPAVSPAAEEICDNGLDDDCDGGPGDCGLEGTLFVEDADVVFLGTTESDLGRSLASAGDLTGDGQADLALGAPAYTSDGLGQVWVVPGPLTSATLGESGWLLTGERRDDKAGLELDAGGDLDGDGLADLVIGGNGHRQGQAYVIYGPVTGDQALADAPVVLRSQTDETNFPSSVGLLGDADGDGVGDLALTHTGVEDSTGAIYVWSGASLESDAPPTATLSGSRVGQQLGDRVGSADLDGDGVQDLLSGAYSDDLVAGFFGPITADRTTDDADLLARGCTVGVAGDLDGDGWADLVAADPKAGSDGTGAVWLVLGPVTGDLTPLDLAAATFLGAARQDKLGEPMSLPGDVDRDGHADLALAGSGSSGDGFVAIFHGPFNGTLGLGDAPATLVGGGFALDTADLDGDGDGDLILGNANFDNDAGLVAVFWGGGL